MPKWYTEAVTLQRPWQRVKTPVELPAISTAGDLQAIAGTAVFEEILRDHLDPRSRDVEYGARWRKFWGVIGFDRSLSDTAGTILESFLSAAERHLDEEDLDSEERKRVDKFADRCDRALDRLDRTREGPLAWAGQRAVEFNPRAREVIEVLVQAIATHRRTGDGPALWNVLAELHLDPDSPKRRRK